MPTLDLLVTNRLLLRRPASRDIPAIVHACQDPVIQQVISHTGPYTAPDAANYLRAVDRGWNAGTRHTWAIIPPDGNFAGQISLTNGVTGEATIGYWLADAHRGQGILPEAAAAVIDHALHPAGLNLISIRWNAYTGNLASARVAQKLGFAYTETAKLGTLNWNRNRDAWVAHLNRGQDRAPQTWPVLEPVPA